LRYSAPQYAGLSTTVLLPLSPSIATCSTRDAAWPGGGTFPPLLPAIDVRSLAAGPRFPPSTWGPEVDVFTISVYHLTWMDAHLS
jgi:hypothetical protein